MKNTYKKGFTIFFAMLIASLSLALGLAIYDLSIRELELSSTATQSQYAIYAADTGADCALYWDFQCPVTGSPIYCQRSGGSAYATSGTPNSGQPGVGSGLLCNGQDITASWSGANPLKGPNAATTTFNVYVSAQTFATPTTTCASVQVSKYTDGNGILHTNVLSRGYNTDCPPAAASIPRIERALQVSY